MQNSCDIKYEEYLEVFNKYFNDFSLSLDKSAPNDIRECILYSVNNGGKRVRPVLGLAVCDILGVDFESAKYFLLALEFIHSYSLVHDDLPCMDDDDYRRGKLSTHKKFGEALGVLTGDALLNLAVEICLKKQDFSQKDLNAMRVLFEYSGYSGMIAGQVLDIQGEDVNKPTEDDLNAIYINKTAKLLTAPLLIASCLSGGKFFNELKEYGYSLGMTFQIVDDIMDVECSREQIGKTPNKDAEENKLTSIKVFGLEGAKAKAEYYFNKSIDAIRNVPNNDFLVSFARKLFLRRT